MKSLLPVFVPLVLAVNLFAEEVQWDRFRGPNGTGVLEGAKPPAQLMESNLKWKTVLPVGYSSPVVWNDFIFLTALEGQRLVTICVDRSRGDILWKKMAPQVALEEVHEASHPTASTPVADQDHVYVYFGSYGLICYDHQGSEVWQKQLPVKQRGYGASTSPITHKQLVILLLDDREKTSRILAFNKSDGTTAWEIPRPLLRSNGYSTPVIWNSGSREELVVLGFEQLNSYDATNGEELWWITGLSRQPVPVPIVAKERIYMAAADRGGEGGNPSDPDLEWKGLSYFDADKDGKIQRVEMTEGFGYPLRPELHPSHPGWGFAIRNEQGKDRYLERLDLNKDGGVSKEEYREVVGGRSRGGRGRHAFMSIRSGASGDAKATHVEWTARRGIAEIPTPVFYEDRLYSVRDGGIMTCFDAADGDVVFRGRIGEASGQYCASLIAADGKVYIASANGVVSILKAGSELSVISQHDFEEEIYATPALHRDGIYVRTNQHLYAFQ